MFYVEIGPFSSIIVCDFKIMEEMLMKTDAFNGRLDIDSHFNVDMEQTLKGGHGMHGYIQSQGEEHKEQRRFALRHLRDLGFGKSALEQTIHEEIKDLFDEIREKINNDQEIQPGLVSLQE